jgi:hypothetical protein
MMDGVDGVVSLAQGVVHWTPPERATQAAAEACGTQLANSYGPAQGMPALREAIKLKLAKENGLTGVRRNQYLSLKEVDIYLICLSIPTFPLERCRYQHALPSP